MGAKVANNVSSSIEFGRSLGGSYHICTYIYIYVCVHIHMHMSVFNTSTSASSKPKLKASAVPVEQLAVADEPRATLAATVRGPTTSAFPRVITVEPQKTASLS